MGRCKNTDVHNAVFIHGCPNKRQMVHISATVGSGSVLFVRVTSTGDASNDSYLNSSGGGYLGGETE